MKKNLYYLAASVMMLAACSKEVPVQDNKSNNPEGNAVYTLVASLEEITRSDITSDGEFSWGDTDAIAVWDSAQSEYQTFTIDSGTMTDHTATFVYSPSDGLPHTFATGAKVYFPASIAEGKAENSVSLPTTYTLSTSNAQDVPMYGTKAANGSVTFSYMCAVLRVPVANVPSITASVVFSGTTASGSNTVVLSGTPTDYAYIPVPAATYTSFSISLNDAADGSGNTIASKSKGTSTTIAAGTYYHLDDPISVGHILTFTNETSWAPLVNVWNGSGSGTFSTSGSFPNKLNAYPSVANKYYVVLNTSNFSWATEGAGVHVKFEDANNSSNNTFTDNVYLFRDIDFTIPSGGGLKTDYRVYPYKLGDNSSVTISMIPVIVAKTSNSHDPAKMYIWNSGSHDSESWAKQETMTWIKNEGDYKYWYYSFELNTPTVDFSFIITNNGEDAGKTGDLTAHFKSFKYVYVDNGTVSTESTLPASKNVSLAADKTASNYFAFPSTVYGNIVVVKLGSTSWNVLINQDYNYGY